MARREAGEWGWHVGRLGAARRHRGRLGAARWHGGRLHGEGEARGSVWWTAIADVEAERQMAMQEAD